MAILPSRLGIAILSHPPLMKVAPGVISIIGVGRIRRQSRNGRCGVRRTVGPRKRTETIIHNKPVGESELFIITNRKCQSHLMHQRCWFIGMFPSGISSTMRLPRLSSSAMKDDWIYEREEENRYRISAGGEEQRNSCEWRCVRGQSYRLEFEDLKQRGGRPGMRKRQPQLMEGEAPLH